MARTGPAGKPTAIRILHGDRPSRINTAEPQPRGISAEAPPWLSDQAAAEWVRVAPDLIEMGICKAADAAGFACYCEAVARLQLAIRLVSQAGLVVLDEDGQPRKNPAVAQARDASYEIRMWAREFGLTPSARAGIRVEHVIRGDAGRLLTDGG